MKTLSTKELIPLYAVLFLGFLGYSLTIALFIPMLMDRHFPLLSLDSPLSLRTTLSGLLLAMYPLGQFIGSPIIGKLTDHFGRKKILVLSLMLCLVGFIGIAISILFHQISFLFLFSFFTGICESNMSISQSIIADKCQDVIQRTKLIGHSYSACSLGYIIGPLLGGFAGHALGYSGPFWVTIIGILVIILWVHFSLEETQPTQQGPVKIIQAVSAFKTIFQNPKLTKIYLFNFLIFFSIMGLYRVVPIYIVDKWHPSLHIYSLIISYVSFICLLANLFLLQRIVSFYSTKKLLLILLIIGGLSIIIIVIPQHFEWIWLTYGFAMIPTVMALPTCTTWLSHHAESKEQGQVLGNNQALLVLGEASSAAIGGLIAAIWVPLPIIMMGMILLIAGIYLSLEKSTEQIAE